MISIDDIEAWREDEKASQFIEDQKRWQVKMFAGHWRSVGIVHSSREKAVETISLWKFFYPVATFVVEEVK